MSELAWTLIFLFGTYALICYSAYQLAGIWAVWLAIGIMGFFNLQVAQMIEKIKRKDDE